MALTEDDPSMTMTSSNGLKARSATTCDSVKATGRVTSNILSKMDFGSNREMMRLLSWVTIVHLLVILSPLSRTAERLVRI